MNDFPKDDAVQYHQEEVIRPNAPKHRGKDVAMFVDSDHANDALERRIYVNFCKVS